MSTHFKAPEFEADAFNCPHCGAFAQQHWNLANSFTYGVPGGHQGYADSDFRRVICTHCNQLTLWYLEEMVYPSSSGVPAVNADLDDDIQADYEEAASIVDKSPRGAAALLRLAIQKTCKQLGQPGKNVNTDIGALVAAGTIPAMVQQALDVVRVVGNHAVHPGELDLRDDRPTAMQLFDLVNLIAEIAITNPSRVRALYETCRNQPASKSTSATEHLHSHSLDGRWTPPAAAFTPSASVG